MCASRLRVFTSLLCIFFAVMPEAKPLKLKPKQRAPAAASAGA